MSVFEAMPDGGAPNRKGSEPQVGNLTQSQSPAADLVPPALQHYPETLVPDEFAAPAPSDSEATDVSVGAAVGGASAYEGFGRTEPTWPDVDRRKHLDTFADAEPNSLADVPPPKVHQSMPRRTVVRWSSIAFGAILAALLIIGGLWVATGGRYYIMTTPSMSPALPVGALVLTKPFAQADVQKGTIIAFVAPTGKYRMYTHRVIGIDPAGYRTKGDASMDADGWIVPFTNVRGVVVSVLPGVGWLVRALPWLLLGLLIAIGLAAFVPWRWGVFMPIVAMVIVLSVPLLILKPLVRGELVQTRPGPDAVVARVVNTGLLPLKFTATGIDAVHVAPGHWSDLRLPVPKVTGQYGIDAKVDLGLLGWVLLGLLCALPLLIGGTIALREWRKERAGTLVVPMS